MITPKGNIHNDPVLSFRGLPIEDKDEFTYGLVEEIEIISRTFKVGSKQQEHNLIAVSYTHLTLPTKRIV